jgi:hypothetical protein
LKKLKAIAHAEHSSVAHGQQNDGRFLQSRCSLLRPSDRRGGCITALSFGIAIALEPYGFIFGGFEPLENRGLKVAAGDAAPGVGVRSTLFVMGDVFRNGFRRGKKRFAFLQQRSVTMLNTCRVCSSKGCAPSSLRPHPLACCSRKGWRSAPTAFAANRSTPVAKASNKKKRGLAGR